MDPLPPIPSPPGHVWREIRLRVLPVLVFLGGWVVVGWLWQFQGSGRTLTGVGEGIRAAVVSPQAGELVEILVEPYARVQRGQPIAIIRPVDPQAGLEQLRARVDLERLRSTPTLTQENALDLERLRMEVHRIRSELAVARVRLETAERRLERDELLFREKLLSADAYEFTRGDRDSEKAEVDEKSRAVAEVEVHIAALETEGGERTSTEAASNVYLELEAQRVAASTNWAPRTLQSSIDGVIGTIWRQPGEFVLEGDAVVTVHSERSDRIVGYLRQPFGFQPREGLSVTVRLRSNPRHRFVTEIIHVGPQFEVITNSLAILRDGVLVDAGLPIVVEVPEHVHVRPGEVVDLLIAPSPADRNPVGVEAMMVVFHDH